MSFNLRLALYLPPESETETHNFN